MARLLALEWDDREARAVVASARGESAVIEEAFAIALPPAGEQGGGKQGTGDQDRGKVIGAALAARRIGRPQTLIAVGRANIELKQLSLPPSPDDELPDLVRFQAMRDFNALGEHWPLDFIPLSSEADKPRLVLAAAISPELVKQIQETAQLAGVTPERLALRPCAAASLLRRTNWREAASAQLLVDVLAEEADLTVLVDGQVVFLRTARLPGDALAEEGYRPLLGEIRRTVAAARNQLEGRKVEVIHLCGSGEDHAALAAQIERGCDLPCRLFDPFAGLKLGDELSKASPEHTGRFAPLLGMLLDEAEHKRPAIDFLNPRRRPPPPDRRRTIVWAAAAAASVVLLAYFWFWSETAAMDEQIAQLEEQLRSQQALVDKLKDTELAAKEIGAWTASDINWLDELRELSNDFPQAKDVLITQLRVGPRNDGGEISLEGYLREAGTADVLEASLRDGVHRVEGRGLTQDSSKEGYAWRFTTAMAVAPQDAEAYRKRAAEKPPAPVSEEETGPGFSPGGGFGGFGGGFGGGGFGGFGGGYGGYGGRGRRSGEDGEDSGERGSRRRSRGDYGRGDERRGDSGEGRFDDGGPGRRGADERAADGGERSQRSREDRRDDDQQDDKKSDGEQPGGEATSEKPSGGDNKSVEPGAGAESQEGPSR
jgi:Tfp pilus assembly PilM family ATPase